MKNDSGCEKCAAAASDRDDAVARVEKLEKLLQQTLPHLGKHLALYWKIQQVLRSEDE